MAKQKIFLQKISKTTNDSQYPIGPQTEVHYGYEHLMDTTLAT